MSGGNGTFEIGAIRERFALVFAWLEVNVRALAERR